MFVVNVTVCLREQVAVDAESNNEAIDKVMREYLNDELLPSSDKYMNVSFEIEEDKNDSRKRYHQM